MSFPRSDRSILARWWTTIDQALLTAVLLLIAIGLVVSLAASPAVADAKGLRPFYFVERHSVHVLAGFALMIVVSMLDPRAIRRLALAIFVFCIAAMIAVLIVGPEFNGARRWLSFGSLTIQPSEFAKPAFVVLAAWALAEHRHRQDMPGLPIAVALAATFVLILLQQPDLGQSILVIATWAALLVLSGLPLIWPVAVTAAGLVAVAVAYLTFDYVRNRVDAFISGDLSGDSQTVRATRAFLEGGLLGRGPGEGTIKTDLPDAHTDFIFAVIAEEYGIIACLVLVLIYGLIVFRLVQKGIAQNELSDRFALIGLSVLFGLQAMINMGVNAGLVPATGMTLPLISAGGSSVLAISLTLGMGLALGRRRPQVSRLKRPTFGGKPNAFETDRGSARHGAAAPESDRILR